MAGKKGARAKKAAKKAAKRASGKRIPTKAKRLVTPRPFSPAPEDYLPPPP